MREKLDGLISILQNDPSVTRYCQLGYCRLWTREAVRVARVNLDPLTWEISVRECHPYTDLTHTFIRVWRIADHDLSYFYDGTGIGRNFPPYYGPEADAPHYLRKNHLDTFSHYF